MTIFEPSQFFGGRHYICDMLQILLVMLKCKNKLCYVILSKKSDRWGGYPYVKLKLWPGCPWVNLEFLSNSIFSRWQNFFQFCSQCLETIDFFGKLTTFEESTVIRGIMKFRLNSSFLEIFKNIHDWTWKMCEILIYWFLSRLNFYSGVNVWLI